jgi:hypothetical protein
VANLVFALLLMYLKSISHTIFNIFSLSNVHFFCSSSTLSTLSSWRNYISRKTCDNCQLMLVTTATHLHMNKSHAKDGSFHSKYIK